MEDNQLIKQQYLNSLNNHDYLDAVRCLMKMIDNGRNVKSTWYRLAFLCGKCGREAMFASFINEKRVRFLFAFGVGNQLCEDAKDVDRFLKLGQSLPMFGDDDIRFIEQYSTVSSTCDMIRELLSDQNSLLSRIKFYTPVENKVSFLSDQLIDAVQKGTIWNYENYWMDDIHQERYSGGMIRYSPIYIFNVINQSVELSTERLINDKTKIILDGWLFVSSNRVKELLINDNMWINIDHDLAIEWSKNEIILSPTSFEQVLNKISSNKEQIVAIKRTVYREWLHRQIMSAS